MFKFLTLTFLFCVLFASTTACTTNSSCGTCSYCNNTICNYYPNFDNDTRCATVPCSTWIKGWSNDSCIGFVADIGSICIGGSCLQRTITTCNTYVASTPIINRASGCGGTSSACSSLYDVNMITVQNTCNVDMPSTDNNCQTNCSRFLAGWAGNVCQRHTQQVAPGLCTILANNSVCSIDSTQTCSNSTTPYLSCGSAQCRRLDKCQNGDIASNSSIADVCFINSNGNCGPNLGCDGSGTCVAIVSPNTPPAISPSNSPSNSPVTPLVVINSSLVITQDTVLNTSILLTSTSTLYVTSGVTLTASQDGCITVNGGSLVLVGSELTSTFIKGCINGTFSSITTSNVSSCNQVLPQYSSTGLALIFQNTCSAPLAWWKITLIVVVPALAAAIVLIAAFRMESLRRKIFPFRFRDKPKASPNTSTQGTGEE